MIKCTKLVPALFVFFAFLLISTNSHANNQNLFKKKFIKGEVLIKFSNNVTSLSSAESIAKNLIGPDVRIKKHFKSISRLRGQHYILLESQDKEMTTEKMIALLENHEAIEAIQPNYIYRFQANPKTRISEKISADSSMEFVLPLLDKDKASEYPRPLAPARAVNSTAPNEQTKYLSGDFTDTDDDGMTDAAELKYGFDSNDASSFPAEPTFIDSEIAISNTGINAKYEASLVGITIRWTNPTDGTYSLTLDNGSQSIYYGGHSSGYAEVNYQNFSLSGTETLTGHFTEYNSSNQWVQDFSDFTIDLSSVSSPVLGDANNEISYTFKDFPSSEESVYREFLKRVFPIMHYMLGPPAEPLNCVITNMGASTGYFMVTDRGRTFLSDTDFIPRLIVHELVHAWKGTHTFTSDENWDYDNALSGFEEGTAEGMAFEIVHEYIRSYPDDSASIQLLDYRPYQYWSSKTTYYDLIKHNRWTGAGDFWTPTGGQTNRYSIAATTFQIMVKENPDAYNEIMQSYFAKITNDNTWTSNRTDILDIWAAVVPQINGVDTKTYINAIPVFQGHKLDEGVYVLNVIRHYGTIGDQQLTVSYVPMDGKAWWGILKSQIDSYNIPSWIKYDAGDDSYYYIDMQGQSFTVDIFDSYDNKIGTYNESTVVGRSADGTANGLGWKMVNGLAMGNFPIGFYREKVTFNNFIQYDNGASENFFIFGYENFSQNYLDYVIMVGIDGVTVGDVTVTIQGENLTQSINNGVAIFSSSTWPLDMEGKFPIKITNSFGQSQTYYRTILEAGTVHNYFQYQFAIIDENFDGIEETTFSVPIPTLSEWAIVILVCLILIFSINRLKYKYS